MHTTLYLIRHGEYENPLYLYPGRLPGYPLSVRGREQVRVLASYLSGKPITALYSSPILRTRQTADILSSGLGLPIMYDDRLKEVHTGLDGTSMKRFDETNGELSYLPEYLEKGAESWPELVSRLSGFIADVRNTQLGKDVVAVTHGDPMRAAVMSVTGSLITFEASRQIETPLAGGYILEFDMENKGKVYPIVTT